MGALAILMAKRDPKSLKNAPDCKKRRLGYTNELSNNDLDTELELFVQLKFKSLEKCKNSGQLQEISNKSFVEFSLNRYINGNAMIKMKGSVTHLSQATIAVFELIRKYTPGYQLLILLNKVT